jgi:hypothetical protein
MDVPDSESQDLESQALLTSLDAQRASVLAIVDGLDEDALRALWGSITVPLALAWTFRRPARIR